MRTRFTHLSSRLSRLVLPAMLSAILAIAGFTAGAQQWTVGTGTTTNAYYTYPTPYGAYYSGQREQYLYKASELSALGITSGPLQQIAFNIAALNNYAYQGAFTIKVWTTSITSLTTWQTAPGTAGIYSIANHTLSTTGWKTYNFSPAVNYNTGDGIIVEVCHWNGPITYTENASVYQTSVSNAAIDYYADSGGPFCGASTSYINTFTTRPNARFTRLLPCAGAPTKGTTTPSGTQTVCPGTVATIQANGYSIASAITLQWMYSVNGGTTWNQISGANSDFLTTFPITQTTRFHMVVYCGNSNQSDSTADVIYNVSGGFPSYAGLPFTESFESWTNGCSTSDLPSTNWTNSPKTGEASWRRDDQGSTASQSSPTYGAYTPVSIVGAHSARFHASYSPGKGGAGQLSCYVNCSAALGNKQLDFYLRTDPGLSYPNDSVYVDMSTDGGVTFSNIGRYGAGTGGWDFKSITFLSNSATTVIRWTAWSNYNYIAYTDIGLDGVKVLPPCTGAPTAGKIDSITVCTGKNFTLSTTGTSASAGLAYQWQYKPTGSSVGWANVPGGTIAKPTANISVPTSFRVIVSCTNSTPPVDDTSAVFDVKLRPFYYCYCDVPTSVNYPYNYAAIGNVSVSTRPAGVTLMSNTTGATPTYNFYSMTVPAPTIIRDSTYRFSMTPILGTQGYYYSAPSAFYLDWNRNGIWDLPGERIMAKTSASTANTPFFQDWQVPSAANVGLTGLRAIIAYATATPLDPCGVYYYQPEIEDYLVYIEYQPCNGPVTPGTAYISDTSVCPGYTVDLWDTSYEKMRTGIVRVWQVSVNGGASYTNIPGSVNKDTIFNVPITSSVYGTTFRLAVVCTNSGDTAYSNTRFVTNPPPVSCYPFASAIPPGSADSSDIGSFQIGDKVNPLPVNVSGPHLNNPAANRRRTDYTYINGITLAADSTYRLAIFHTMRTVNHANAVVSVFIDFNHDGKYTVNSPGYPFPSELIYRGYTTASNYYLDTFVTMPSDLIPNVPTGMRVILNNDLNVSTSGNGNDGSGGFISGEVEDYVVTLSRTALGVGSSKLVQNFAIFPNPTDAKSTLAFDAVKAISHLDVTVTTLTGQTVISRSYENPAMRFSTEIDLSGKAKGVYFVEIRADGEKLTRKLVVH